MTALEKYIDDLVNDKEPQDDFPKNESSWEELYDLCGRLIAEIVTLRRLAAQQMREPDAPKSAPVCTCSMDDGIHEWNCALETARRLR